MPELAWVNGKLSGLAEAVVPCLDRGNLFGDGVYEVVRVYAGRPFAQERHLRRLKKSLAAVQIEAPLETRELDLQVRDLITRSGIGEAQVYIQITRGAAPRQHAFPRDARPSLILFVLKVETDFRWRETGCQAISLPDDRWAHCHIKSLNLLPNVLAKEKARSKGAQEALFVAGGGAKVREGSSSNVFALLDGKVVTPPADGHILAGITREIFLELAETAGLPVLEQDLSLAELLEAQEVFFTSTVSEYLPVSELDGKRIGTGHPGPKGQELYALYSQLCQTGDGS